MKYIYSPWLAKLRAAKRRKALRLSLFFIILVSTFVVMAVFRIPSRTVYFNNVAAETKTAEKKVSHVESKRSTVVPKVTNGSKLKDKTVREVTMYSSTPHQTDSTPCVGKSGEDQCELWRKGENICATNAFQVGTVLQVNKLGDCVVKDSMNHRYRNRIDWYAGYNEECLDGIQTGDDCPTYERALRFGTQHLLVAVYSN